MIRALGQNPTEAEVKRLMQETKKGDRVIDGAIISVTFCNFYYVTSSA